MNENIEETTKVDKQDNEQKIKVKKDKSRMIFVIAFILILAVIIGIQSRASYLEYYELGEQYLSVLETNFKYEASIIGVNFIFIYFVVYMTNRGIKKGLKPFFEKEKKEIPKLLNKSLALIIATVSSVVVNMLFAETIMLALNSTSFGINDSIFNLDLSYFMFLKPLYESIAMYAIVLFIGLTIYMSAYYIIAFNKYFEGVDGEMVWNSLFIKKAIRNVFLAIVAIAVVTVLNIQNMAFGTLLKIGDTVELTGAGMTATTIQLWGYIIFALIIIIFSYRGLRAFKEKQTTKVIKNLAVIPIYLVSMFIVMIAFDFIYVKTNELDREKEYIQENISSTKKAYNIEVQETTLDYTGTITAEEVSQNSVIVNNIPIVSEDTVINTLQEEQTITGQFTYKNADLAKYEIAGEETLVYLSPREVTNQQRTYNNRTYEYTHGMGGVIVDASSSDENGNIQYVQKDIAGSDELVDITEPRIYFGLETNEIVITNTEVNKEYDYTDENGVDYMSSYSGDAGLKLGLFDRLILGLSKGNFDLAFSGDITENSKILLNTQILDRAEKALPYLIYDKEPYSVITDDGNIVWVIDAYTVSSNYPYSQYTKIEEDGITQNINYIRNSVKVIVDAYDGTMSYYITDRTDPIAMAYREIYPELFMDLDIPIAEDISEHFVYPEFLYNIQAEMLEVYHNVKPDVLYREDDIWDTVRHNTTTSTQSVGTDLEPYYTLVNTENGQEVGLIQMYTKEGKQNITSYLVGTSESEINKLKIYKFPEDSNIVGPLQLNNQIEEDETISSELDSLNETGTRITKEMIIIPIGNTLLYVEPIYQTFLNETDVPVLKKVIVASGNKVAIGDTIEEALINLLSKEAVDIVIENTDDIEGIIDSIIRTNEDLSESNENGDWELMGRDIEKLQELIDSLEKLRDQEKLQNEEDEEEIETVEIEDKEISIENQNTENI